MTLNRRRKLPTPTQEELELLDAADAGDVERAKTLLVRGVNVNARDNREMPYNATPLMFAARGGHLDMVNSLLSFGADIYALDTALPGEGGRNSCLHYAVEGGSSAVVRRLMEEGAEVDARNSGGKTPLCLAAWTGNVDVVGILLEAGARPDLEQKSNWPPLLQAAVNGHKKIVELLLQRGADPDAPDAIGMTPLMEAAASSWPDSAEIVRLLLKGGASVAKVDRDGKTALCWAVLGGNPETVRILLQSGASADFRFRDDQTTLLELAEKRYNEGLRDKNEDTYYRQRYKEIISLLRSGPHP